MKQERVQRQGKDESSMRDIALADAEKQSGRRAEKTQQELDDSAEFLEEIDELIADIDAEQFVRGYIQKGGQ